MFSEFWEWQKTLSWSEGFLLILGVYLLIDMVYVIGYKIHRRYKGRSL